MPEYEVVVSDVVEFELLGYVFDEVLRNLSQVDVLLPGVFYDDEDWVYL